MPEQRPAKKADRAVAVLRDADRRDEPFLREMAILVFAEFGDYRQSLKEWLREQSVLTRIAETEAGAAGFYMLEIFPGPFPGQRPGSSQRGRRTMTGYLLAVGVRPELQRRGIGRLLVEDALCRAQEARPSVTEVRLSVAQGNDRARRLFGKLGFLDCGLDQRLYENGQQAMVMSLTL